MKKLVYKIFIIYILLLSAGSTFAQVYTKQPLTSLDSAQIKKYTENYEMYYGKSDLRNASDFLNQIANIYWNRNNFEKATEYFLKSLELNEKLGNKNGMAGIHSNLGMIYSDMGQFQKSVDHLEQAVILRRLEKNTPIGRENLFNSLLNLAAALKQLGKYDPAIKYLEEALDYAKESNNIEKIAIFYLQLAEVHESAGHEALSKSYAEKYLIFYKQMQDEKVNKSQMAMENEMLRAARIELEKKVKEMELQEKTVELEKKEMQVKAYSSKADSLADNLSKAQLAQKYLEEQALKEKIQKQRNIIIFTLAFAFVAIIALFFYYSLRQKQKANVLLSQKNTEILNQKNEIAEQRDELDLKNQELYRKNNQIMESINYAKLIQTAMLQRETALDSYIPDSFILFKPKNVVSGDFYWYTNKNNKLVIATIDCTGHGVPGAFMSMIGANILNQIVLLENITEPDLILEELHTGINLALNQHHTGNDDGMDASVMVIDKKKKLITFSGARNPLVIIKDGEMTEIEGDEISIGGTHRQKNDKFTKKSIPLSNGMKVYSFSDGYQDQFGGSRNRKFMQNQLNKLLFEIHEKDMAAQKEILNQTIENWKDEGNGKQTDDILIIGMHLEL
ncbi:MAG: tetratricopeptide repeat protein [Bacteroidales bacterium]